MSPREKRFMQRRIGSWEKGDPDVRKMCRLDDLWTTLGYDEPKKMSVKDNTVSFDKNSVYALQAWTKKEHTAMLKSATLTDDFSGKYLYL